MPVGKLIDTTKCIRCRNCEFSCHKYYQLENKSLSNNLNQGTLDAYHYNFVDIVSTEYQDRTQVIGVHKRCFHCFDPACASVCPVGALHKLEVGAVIWEDSRCIGCRYCQNACPFHIPKFEWDKAWPKISKCHFCYQRLAAGQIPVCAEVCPTEAIKFGERADLLAEAYRRMDLSPGRYYPHVYGEHEAGGTGVMYIGAVPPENLGFLPVETELYPPLTWEFLSRIPVEMAAISAVLAGVYLFRERRMAAKTGKGEITGAAKPGQETKE